jgi:hypothetical protein
MAKKPKPSSTYVKEWRRRCRQRIADAFGGKCAICGYRKCLRALECHHLDPAKKEFTFGRMITRACNWGRVVAELRKCVMLCSNCHKEVHAGEAIIPNDAPRFNEEFADYRAPEMEPCPVCGNSKLLSVRTCSVACGHKKLERTKWPENLAELVASSSRVRVAKMLGVSDKAVAKRLARHCSMV